MHFTKFLTTMAFASLAIAATIPNGADLAERALAKPATPAKAPAAGPLVAGTGPFKNVKGTKAAWADLAAGHGKGTKRDVERRAVPAGFLGVEVFQGGHDGFGSIPLGLYTEGLVTCFGIVIKGDAPAGSTSVNTRWLLHMQATSDAGDWTPFEAKVRAAGLTNMQGYMSVPSPAAVGTKIAGRTWSQADQDLSTQMITAMTTAVRTLTGRAPIVHQRPMSPPSSMQIDGTGQVSAAGHKL
ncbi:hypothetical protein M430DRAFT_30853 [Amorphotheca resinae ATCC 22711]|jgi:hypothetical protein|uniref:Uncharacterized protein n=1 Tax=Amorphotheca resinae ATCC 22711 TaxID=857342 RepID=A0A2T3ARF6_AMORE|nr:hypothetical protein M430DRAFT_30853 [Amorphotheca resinae ATCC 22711]PSS08936.1 hypothetical protein M430DRAFT_30853 [Amorphotheca resinae ATCC 22711]